MLVQNAFASKYNGNIQINVNGKQRTYKLYVPDNVAESAPLVFSLHGTGGSCDWGHPEFNSLADQNGFIVAYPSGENVYYPEFGASMPGWQATGTTSDDTDFFLAIIEDVNNRYAVDSLPLPPSVASPSSQCTCTNQAANPFLSSISMERPMTS